MPKILLVLFLAIAILPRFYAIDFWATDYYVGFSILDGDSALAVTTVCESLVAWGQGSYQEPPHNSIPSILARARTLFHISKDHFGATLLLCHSKKFWLSAAGASSEHSLQMSNLLGMSFWECSHFAGARAAFKLAESIMANISSSGRDCWALEADTLDGSETLLPAPIAVLLNAAHVAADAWDFATAQDLIERSKILQEQTPHKKALPIVSALEFSNSVVKLREKPGHLHRVASIVNHALNASSFVRALRESSEHAVSLAALQSSYLWEGYSPETNFTRYNWPPRIVECMMQDLIAVASTGNSNIVIDAAVRAMHSLVSIVPEGETSSAHCTLALQTGVIYELIRIVASSRARQFHHVSAISALAHLVHCDGSLSFITSYGIEVMTDLIRHGSKAERMSAARIMKDVVRNVASMIKRAVIQQHAIHRTVFRFMLGIVTEWLL